jgi:hypothetical protein
VHTWVLLHYKIPREPTAPRVSAWRKLKRLGAILLQDAVWVLPATPRTREDFQWLAAEIGEQGGEATLWEAQLALPGHDEALVQQFLAQVDGAYGAILADLKREDVDLAALARRYQQVQGHDYFHSELGQRVREALLLAGGGRDT